MNTIIIENESNYGFPTQGLNKEKRFFIPMVSVYTNQKILKAILPHTSWIGFNLFDVKRSHLCDKIRSQGLRETFAISGSTKIFLATTDKDKNLIKFFSKPDWLQEMRLDLINLKPDAAMGPDWFAYRDNSPERNNENIKKAIELNMKLVDIENVIPTIRGNYSQEIRHFIEPFKAIGKNLFVFTGREYLMNIGNRKRSEFELFSVTSKVAKEEKVYLIVTGVNSPRQMDNLPEVLGFAGEGWLIQAKRRMLISNKTYTWLSDSRFSCNDPFCCGTLDKETLAKSENDHLRAVHNLRKIITNLNNQHRLLHQGLEEYYGLGI